MIDSCLAALVIACLATLVGIVLWQVFSRFVLSTPSTYTDELARYIMIYLAFLGAAYAVGHHQHLAVDLFIHRLNRWFPPVMVALVYHTTMIFFSGVGLIGGGLRLLKTTVHTDSVMPTMEFSMQWAYLILPIAGTFMTFYNVYALAYFIRSTYYASPTIPSSM